MSLMDQVLLLILTFFISAHFTNAQVCQSFEINHERELHKLEECTTVLGHVRLANFRVQNDIDLISKIEEITDYLLVYRVEELYSLERIFSNLTIIRGNKLLFDKYSLVVYENRNLRDLGLGSLLKITKGSIRIESNPVLCFSDTINWVYLVDQPLTQHYSLNNNLDPNECPLCRRNPAISGDEFFKTNCWNLNHFQRKKPMASHDKCPGGCSDYGCNKIGQCCSSLCLTGCTAEDCRICKNYKNLHGDCVEYCSVPSYTFLDRCISEDVCRKKEWIPHAGTCIKECPYSYQQDFNNGVASCTVNCRHNYTIRKKDDLEPLKDCVIVKGYIHIELRDDKSVTIGDLENALEGIKEIEGYLKIYKSPQLVSLGFFKKLDTIRGEQLIEGEYSLYIVDNHHIEDIWPGNHNVALLNGRIFVHLNPRLCYEKIMQLAPTIKNGEAIRVRDVSRNSNGDRVNCGSKIITIHPVVEAVNATAARIKIEPVSSSYKDVILGYLHFYKEAPVRNISLFDGMHGCGRDNWYMDTTIDLNVRHVLKKLTPNTQYAFFVKTINHVDDHRGTTWQSDIQYFKTLPMTPGPVMKLYASAFSTRDIMVHWWPPKNPNGIIDSYKLRFQAVLQTNYTKFNGYSGNNASSSCDCDLGRSHRGPQPNETHYYNRQQHFVESALPNILYISIATLKRWEEEQRQEDNTRKKRDTAGSSDSPTNKVDLNESETKMSAEDLERQEIFRQYQLEVERLAIAEQDTGIADFPVDMPLPLCAISNPSEEYQKLRNCRPVQHYPGIDLPGTNYTYTLDNLQPKTVYQIFVRACVKGIENGCGPEKSVQTETVSEEMEHFLKEP